MKKYLLGFVLFTSMVSAANAQESSSDEEANNCYSKWAHKFETRGASEVADGTYADVIISIRNGSKGNVECYEGKCDVVGGKITTMYLKLEDGKFEVLKRKRAPGNEYPITVNNGMSKIYLTADDDMINVLFIKKLKPKKAEFKKAIDPDDLVD